MDNLKLYAKIYAVMNESEALTKDLTVGSGNNSYRAVGEKEVLNMLKPLFKAHKLIIFPTDGEITEQNSVFDTSYKGDVTTKTRNVTQLKVFYKIVDIESGESELIVGFGNGADSQDKGSGKAFTYSFKTALSKTFMLFSGEDTDNTHSDDINKNTSVKAPVKPEQQTFNHKPQIEDEVDLHNDIVELGKQHGYTIGDIKMLIFHTYKKTLAIESLEAPQKAVIQAKIVSGAK